ncbi:hypothetical protein H8E88_16650 [candidate division KSB1 bacterium]|nr:hypothetical protein [candidate division KSB1 bacterium]
MKAYTKKRIVAWLIIAILILLNILLWKGILSPKKKKAYNTIALVEKSDPGACVACLELI